MVQIEIDKELQSLLRARAKGGENSNDTLRRLLGLNSSKAKGTRAPKRKDAPAQKTKGIKKIYGATVADLMLAGLVRPGDKLLHHQTRKLRRLHAIIEVDGQIRTKIKLYDDPSPALSELRGTSANGWADWKHVRSGKSLSDLREELKTSRSHSPKSQN